MKRMIFLSKLALASVVIVSACSKTETEKMNVPVSNLETIEFVISADDVKATINEGKCLWEANDEIKVVYMDDTNTQKSVTAVVQTAGASASISASVDIVDYYYAVYPASISAVLDTEGNITIDIPDATDGTLKNAMICVAKTSREDASFTFQHAVSLLSFEINRDDVKSVDIVTKEDCKLSGNVQCSFTDGSFVTGSAERNTHTVSISGAGRFYAPIPEGVSVSAMALKMRTSDANESIPAVNVVPAVTLTFGRNALKNLGQIDNRVITDYYFSTDGSGDGKTSAAPASFAVFKSMLANDLYHNFIVDGATLHFLAGTYTFDSIVSLAPKCVTTIALEGDSSSSTIFSGNSSNNFFSVNTDAVLSIKNLTLKSGKSATNGGAMTLNGGKLIAENCEISSNTAASGGAIYATGLSDLYFKNCKFFSNTSTGTANAPSVIMLWGNAFAKFNSCVFGSNTASNRAVINSQQNSLVFLNACAFNNNKNSAASTYASAIHAAGAGFAINNSTFYQNNGKGTDSKPLTNCECINATANMVITNTTFYEYFQANRGVIAATAAKKGVLFNDIILNNYSGTVLYFSSANYTFTSKGHNIYRSITDYRTGDYKVGLPTATGDISGVAANILSGASWDSTNRVYTWNGSLTTGTLTMATPSEFETAVKSMTEVVNNSIVGTSTQLGTAFWNWLVSISATTNDQLGNERGLQWWPGSYQQ